MSGFLGTFADLRGQRLGDNFFVDELVGRKGHAPRYSIRCRLCGHWQVMDHVIVYALVQGSRTARIFCTNSSCPLSRDDRQTETLSDALRVERKIAREQAQAAAEAQSRAEAVAVKNRAEAATLEALKSEWREYYLHQLCTDLPEKEIATWERWQQFGPQTQQMILDTIRKNPRSLIHDYVIGAQ